MWLVLDYLFAEVAGGGGVTPGGTGEDVRSRESEVVK